MESESQVCFNCGDSIKNEIFYCFNCDLNIKNANRKFYIFSLLISPILVIIMSTLQSVSLNIFGNFSFFIALSVEIIISPALTIVFLYALVKGLKFDTRKSNLSKLIALEYIIVLTGEVIGYFLQVWLVQPIVIDPILNSKQNNIGNLFNLSIANSVFLFAGAFQFVAILFLLLYLLEPKDNFIIPVHINRNNNFIFFSFLIFIGIFPSLFDIIENNLLNNILRDLSFNVYNFIFLNNLFYILSNILLIVIGFVFFKLFEIKHYIKSIETIAFMFVLVYLGSIIGNILNWLVNPLNFISLTKWNWDGALYIIILSITTSFTITSYLVFIFYLKKKSSPYTSIS